MGIIQRQALINSLISYSGLLVGFVNVLILQPIILSPGEIGLLRIMYSSAVLIGTIFPLGLNGTIIKFFPSYRDEKHAHYGFLGKFTLLAMPGFAAMSIGIYFFRDFFIEKYSLQSPLFVSYFSFVLPMAFFIGFANLFSIYLFANYKSVFPSLVNDLFLRLFSTVLLALYYFNIINSEQFVQLFFAGYGLQFLSLLFFTRSIGSIIKQFGFFQRPPTLADLMPMIRFSFTMSIVTIANMALKNMDVIFMGSYLSLNEVGVYTIAVLVAGFIEIPVSALGRIADSKIARAFHEGNLDEVKKIYFDSVRILSAAGIGLFVLICSGIQDAFSFLPSSYTNGFEVVWIAGIASLSNMVTGINSSMLFYTKYVKIGSVLLVLLVLTNIVLNILLIPALGINGAALALAISFVCFNLAKYLLILKLFHFNPYGSYFISLLGIGFLTLCSGYIAAFIPNDVVRIATRFFIQVSAYSLLLYRNSHFPEVKNLLTKFTEAIRR